MKIYTSRFGNKAVAQTGLVPVSISLGNPRFKTAFKIASRIKALAPTRDMLQMEYAPYKKLYFKMLDVLGIDEIKQHFKRISTAGTTLPLFKEKGGDCNGKDLVLLCFEDLSKEGEWCHRRIFAEWWQKKTGNKIEEL